MMSVVSRTKGSRDGIWAEILSSQSPATGEYNSECRIYRGEQTIGYLTDDDVDLLCIRGEFDYQETGEYMKVGVTDVPQLVDNALYLNIDALLTIKKIMEYWESECEKHEDMWEEIK